MMYSRLTRLKLQRMLENFPCVAVTGARQVGKTTLLSKLVAPNAKLVTFDPYVDIGQARADPELFLNNNPPPLILDEIQYSPELVSSLKRKIDLDRTPGQYLVTGSQQWQVMKNLAESLAGRVVFLDLEGLCLKEIAGEGESRTWLESYLENPENFLSEKHSRLRLPFTSFEQIWRGWLPELQGIPLDLVERYFFSYRTTYLERDVRILSEISDLPLFSRFLSYGAALTAQEINFSEFGRELGIHHQTAQHWLDLLKATFQWIEIPAFSLNAVKRSSMKPKGYFADTGFAANLQYLSSPGALAGHPLWGALFETAVVQDLRKQLTSMSGTARMWHWRTHTGMEVDLILERDGKYFPIEIKGKSRPDSSDSKGLRAFRKAFPKLSIQPGLVISLADEIYPLSKQDWVLPWDLAG